MPSSPNEAAASETIIPAQTENTSESTSPNHRTRWRFWSGGCFAIVVLAAFARPLLALVNYAAGSQLYSYILLIPFVSAYLLYLRRDQLPKTLVTDLPLAVVSLAVGLGVLVLIHWLDFVRQRPSDNDRLALLTLSFLCFLAAGGFFFFGRGWMRSAAFPLAYLIFMVPMPDAMADALETASKYASAEVANLLFHLSGTPFLRAGLHFSTAEHHDRSCTGMQRHSIELGAFDDQHPGRQFILEDAMAPVCARRLRHSTCHFTERISHSCDRASLCECRAANDSQLDPPARRSTLFHAFVDSIFSSVMVAAQGRRPDPTTGVALSFTEDSNL